MVEFIASLLALMVLCAVVIGVILSEIKNQLERIADYIEKVWHP